MTPRYWVDTNVILDHLLGRPPLYQASRDLIEPGYHRKAEILVTPASVATVLYVLQRKKSARKPGPDLNKVRHALLQLLQVVEVIPMERSDFSWSANSHFLDLEDGAQYSAAMGSGRLDALVTNNKADFPNVTPPLWDAAEALAAFKAHAGRPRYVAKRQRRKR
ncbi:MAG: PIN domain-containing protein [Flavobacteriales bacterium]|jgi:predicted nucleic acid-binding protein|nr:PIN domain-containing protein [Flavobacteriales bacterium]